MQTLSPIWLLIGIAVGICGAAFVSIFYIRNLKPKIIEVNDVVASSVELLDALGSAGVVLSSTNRVVRATSQALSLGVLDGWQLASKRLISLVNRARESDKTLSAELELSSGRRKPKLHVSARARALSGGNVLLVLDDRTESHRLDEMRKDFMANISHELKTPIGAVGLLSEAMENSLDQPEVLAKLLRNIRKESKRLTALVQDIIQLSRIQGTSTVAISKQINLVDVVKDAIDRNSWRSEKSDITIDFETVSDKVNVMGDAEMLTVAVKNLVENAIIYSNPGSTVAVVVNKANGYAQIVVKDTGIGIAKADLSRVFERFYRVDQSRSRETGGTGLGLSIVKHAAITHQGDVQLFSKPGIGSTFTLRLPMVDTKVLKQTTRKVNRG
jgi:two-component system sensor histidine kinase SenX3